MARESTFVLNGGLRTWVDPVSLRPEQTSVWTNVDPFRSIAAAVSRKGRSVFIAAQGGGTRVNGLVKYTKADGTAFWVVSGGTKFYDATGGAWTDITGALTPTNTDSWFAQLNNVLFVANKGEDVCQWSGSGSFAALTDANRPAVPSGMVVWSSRIWCIDGTKTVKWSKTNDGANWSEAEDASGAGVQIEPDDGSDLLALVPASTYLLVCKSNKIYEFTGRTFADFEWRQVRSEGIVDPKAWISYEGVAIVGTPSGIWTVGSRLQERHNLATPILDVWRDTIARSGRVRFGYANDTLYVAYDSDSDGVCDSGYALFMPLGKWSKWTGQPISSYFSDTNGDLYAGTDDGRIAVLKLEDTYQDEGANITTTIRSKAFMLSESPFSELIGDQLRVLVYANTGARTLTIKTLRDNLTPTTHGSAQSIQNASGRKYIHIDADIQSSEVAKTLAIELESSGGDEMRIQGFMFTASKDDDL